MLIETAGPKVETSMHQGKDTVFDVDIHKPRELTALRGYGQLDFYMAPVPPYPRDYMACYDTMNEQTLSTPFMVSCALGRAQSSVRLCQHMAVATILRPY